MKKLFFVSLLFLFPQLLGASEFYLQSFKNEISVGEEVEIWLKINSEGEKVNALSGRINYDPTTLELINLSEGGSVINFWIDRPKDREVGVIDFSGITPGGFTVGDGTVTKLKFKALASGLSKLEGEDFIALKHDGLGTPTPVQFKNLQININEKTDIVNPLPAPSDVTPPEDFTPQVVSQPDIFDGDKVLIFATNDQDSGVVSYYVREYQIPFLKYLATWKKTESPYRLRDQSRSSYVEVKAVDVSGNERLVQLLPENPPSFYWYWIILIIAFLVFMRVIQRREYRPGSL